MEKGIYIQTIISNHFSNKHTLKMRSNTIGLILISTIGIGTGGKTKPIKTLLPSASHNVWSIMDVTWRQTGDLKKE